MMLYMLRTMCGPDFRPKAASFAHRRPDDIEAFRKLFRVPLYFDGEHYALVFSRNWLRNKPPGAETDIQELIWNQINARDVKHRLSFPDQWRNVLRLAVMTGQCSEEEIALLFSMHSHTLSRRLETFGTSYHELVEECRFEIARQMLENTSLSVAQICAALCYSRSSSFIRAFRRWSGTTPAKWQKESD